MWEFWLAFWLLPTFMLMAVVKPEQHYSKKDQKLRKKAQQALNRGDANAPPVVHPAVLGIGQADGSLHFRDEERLVFYFLLQIILNLINNFESMNYNEINCHFTVAVTSVICN